MRPDEIRNTEMPNEGYADSTFFLRELAALFAEANEINSKIKDDNRAYIESELKKANALIAKLGKETELLEAQLEDLKDAKGFANQVETLIAFLDRITAELVGIQKESLQVSKEILSKQIGQPPRSVEPEEAPEQAEVLAEKKELEIVAGDTRRQG